MYIFSVFKNLFKPSNFGAIVFFFLNAGFLFYCAYALGGEEAVLKFALFYILSVMLALSPFGEAVLGTFSGARKMSRADMKKKMVPIIQRVYSKAKAETNDLPNHIILKVCYDPNPNAFALGRRTICVSEGLLTLPEDMIEGIIAHEMGHLSLHHTDIQLLIGGGNIIISCFLLVMSITSAICSAIGTYSLFFGRGLSKVFFSLIGFFCSGMIWLWTKFCMLFLMWSSRANEYEADKFAYKIGYGYELAYALDSIGTGAPAKPFLKALYSTHPDTNDRIGKLQELGVEYSKYD